MRYVPYMYSIIIYIIFFYLFSRIRPSVPPAKTHEIPTWDLPHWYPLGLIPKQRNQLPKNKKTPTARSLCPRPPLKFSRDIIIRITLREGENYQIISPISTDTLEINDKLEVQRTSRKRLE